MRLGAFFTPTLLLLVLLLTVINSEAKRNNNYCHKCVSYDSTIPMGVTAQIQEAILNEGIWLPWVYHIRQCADPFDDNAIVPSVKCRTSCYKLTLYLHFHDDEKEIVARGCKDTLMESHKLFTHFPTDSGCGEVTVSEELQGKVEENLNLLLSGSVCFCKGRHCNGAQMASQETFLTGNSTTIFTQENFNVVGTTPMSTETSGLTTEQPVELSSQPTLHTQTTTEHNEEIVEGSTAVATSEISSTVEISQSTTDQLESITVQSGIDSYLALELTSPDYDILKEYDSEGGSGEAQSFSERLEIDQPSMDQPTTVGDIPANFTRVKQTVSDKRQEKITKIPQTQFEDTQDSVSLANRLNCYHFKFIFLFVFAYFRL